MMSTTNEQVRFDVVMQCLQITGDVDAALDAARRIVDFVTGGEAGITTVAGRARPKQGRPQTGESEPGAPDDSEGAATGEAWTEEPVGCQEKPAEAARPAAGVGRGSGPKARWDAASEAKLRAEWATGKPVEVIAAEIGRTVGSTRERARRLGLRRPKQSEVAPEYRAQTARTSAPGAETPRAGNVRTLKASGTRKRRRPRHEDMRRAEPIDISAYRIKRPSETIDSVVNFVRSRDYQVVRASDGTFMVDGRKQFSEDAFVEWANGLRRMLNKPAFALGYADAT